MSNLHAYFGGTFDPIHYGHLCPMKELAAITGMSKITLLPNNVPPHRPQPEATPQQRVEMIELAIADDPLFALDTRELERDEPSWTVTTLEMLRAECGDDQPLAFIIGQDSLLTLNRWQCWQQLPELCHLVVCRRPGYANQSSDPKVQAWINRHLASDVQQLHQQPAGLIYQADTPLYSISATDIRRRYRKGLSCDNLLSPAVDAYIAKAGIYRD